MKHQYMLLKKVGKGLLIARYLIKDTICPYVQTKRLIRQHLNPLRLVRVNGFKRTCKSADGGLLARVDELHGNPKDFVLQKIC